MPTDYDYIDIPYDYPYDVTLTALQSIPSASVPLDNDAPWFWRGLSMTYTDVNFTLRLKDANLRYLSPAPIQAANYQGKGPMPRIMAVELPFLEGGQIQFDIADLSNAENTIQLLFQGVKRYSRERYAACGAR